MPELRALTTCMTHLARTCPTIVGGLLQVPET
jgi:hypothetical protein